VSFADSVGASAEPEAFVPTVALEVPVAENVPLGPLAGAVKVTLTPATSPVSGQPLLATSCTARLVWKTAPSRAVCGVPAVTSRVSGAFVDGHEAGA
jgi:hypothetical protein